jgi:two-component system LytT family sensor kinase
MEQRFYQQFQRIEFWTATGLFILFALGLLSRAINYDHWYGNRHLFENAGIAFNWYHNYMLPTLFKGIIYYASFLLLIFQVVEFPVGKKAILSKFFQVLGVFILMALLTGVCDTWLKAYMLKRMDTTDFYEKIFVDAGIYCLWLFIVFCIYVILKHIACYLLVNTAAIQEKYSIVNRESIIGLIVFMYLLFLMIISGMPDALISFVGLVVPASIALYWLSVSRLIPQSMKANKPLRRYLRDVLLILIVSLFPLSVILAIIKNHGDFIAAFLVINFLFQLLITTPAAWFIYKNRFARETELQQLKTELGTSTANLDFLKSQINPHFLFNALNTLYGTAIQENAMRTGEGIQKLGDMMRFMLEENLQDKIPLNREMDYIKNYLSLQKLRIGGADNVRVEEEVDEQVNALSITPMLLIPIIENAFKHGVSLREPSHIKVSLKLEGNVLYFDVYNSIHRLKEDDPERNHRGIGLQNVKSRLEHHYPHKHELIIRENLDEYFVHLTIQL